MTPGLDHPQQLLQGALALIPQGRLEEAKGLLKQAESMVRIRPYMDAAERGRRARFGTIGVEVVTRLGELLAWQGYLLEALGYLQEAVELGAPKRIQTLFASCVGRVRFARPMPGLKPLLTRAFRELWCGPDELAGVASCALLVEPDFAAAGRSLQTQDSAAAIVSDESVQRVMNDPLLLSLLSSTIVTSIPLERMLTRLRGILLSLDNEMGPDAVAPAPMAFCVGLANQCFANEYAFIETLAEQEMSERLAKRIRKATANGETIEPSELCLLGCYRALHGLDFAQDVLSRNWPPEVCEVVRRQIEEPLRERDLKKTIPRLTAIKDSVSAAVRDQYEENPYPRWIAVATPGERRTLASWLRNNIPGASASGCPDGPFDMLVAGCGTGRDVVTFVGMFEGVRIDAIDLSIASLAYAARKVSELGLQHVRLEQADILELKGLPRRYDLIAAAGVLHHLADPLRGWRILADLTRPGGYMFVSLYSELGRRDIAPLREFARRGKYGTLPEELRRFRAEILALPDGASDRNSALTREDFFNLSMLRDMVFHVSEQRFTLEKIGDAVRALGLEFCGFLVDPELRLEFTKAHGADALLSLEAWDKFEKANPRIFHQMYHFIVQKPQHTGA